MNGGMSETSNNRIKKVQAKENERAFLAAFQTER